MAAFKFAEIEWQTTAFLQFQATWHHSDDSSPKITIGSDLINTSNSAKHLGVLLESNLSIY